MSLADGNLHPFVLFARLTRQYQHTWMAWELPVLRQTLEKDFKSTIAKVNLAKAMATALLATKESFWESWEVFSLLTQALNGIPVDAVTMQEHSVGEMMVAVDVASDIRKALATLVPEPQFHDQVARYVAAQSLHDGIWYLPKPLAFAANHAEGKSYRCLDCGNVSEVVFDDGYCDSCVDRYDTDIDVRNWHPSAEVVAKGHGRHIEFFSKNPVVAVRDRFEAISANPEIQLQEDQVDVCVSRLLRARAYRNIVDARKVQGLRELS